MKYYSIFVILFIISCSNKEEQNINPTPKAIPYANTTIIYNINYFNMIRPISRIRDSLIATIMYARDSSGADTLMNILYKKYTELITNEPNRFFEQYIPQKKVDSVKSILRLNGYLIRNDCESGDYFACNTEYLLNQVGEYLSPLCKEYYSMISDEEKEELSCEGSLRITFNELAFRIARWESFLRNHPNFMCENEIQRKLYGYIMFYLVPGENHNIYDSGPNRNILEPRLLMSYKEYVRMNPNTEFGNYLQTYLNILENNKYNYTEEVQRYISKYNPQRNDD